MPALTPPNPLPVDYDERLKLANRMIAAWKEYRIQVLESKPTSSARPKYNA